MPQPPRHPQREYMIENLGVTFEENPTINQVQQNQRDTLGVNVANLGGAFEQHRVEPPRNQPRGQIEEKPRITLVNRNENVDNLIQQMRHDDMVAYNNLEVMVKRIMVRNEVNFGLRRSNYTSPLLEYIL